MNSIHHRHDASELNKLNTAYDKFVEDLKKFLSDHEGDENLTPRVMARALINMAKKCSCKSYLSFYEFSSAMHDDVCVRLIETFYNENYGGILECRPSHAPTAETTTCNPQQP